MAPRQGIPVRIIPEDVAGLILNGPITTPQIMKVICETTIARLGLSPVKAKGYSRGSDSHATVHDFKRWCDSLTLEDEEGLATFRRLHATIVNRVG